MAELTSQARRSQEVESPRDGADTGSSRLTPKDRRTAQRELYDERSSRDRSPEVQPQSIELKPGEKLSRVGLTKVEAYLTKPDGTALTIPAGSTIALITKSNEAGLYGARVAVQSPDGSLKTDLPIAGFKGETVQDSKLLGLQTIGSPRFISFISNGPSTTVKFEGALNIQLKDPNPLRDYMKERLVKGEGLNLTEIDPNSDRVFESALRSALGVNDSQPLSIRGVASSDRHSGQNLLVQVGNRRDSIPLPDLDNIREEISTTNLEDELLKLENLNNGQPFNPVDVMKAYNESKLPLEIKQETLRQVMLVIARIEQSSGNHISTLIETAKGKTGNTPGDIAALEKFLKDGLALTKGN